MSDISYVDQLLHNELTTRVDLCSETPLKWKNVLQPPIC